MTAGMPMKPSRSPRKAWTAPSLAALSTHGAVPPARAAANARPSAGNASRSGGSKVSEPTAARSSAGTGTSTRSGGGGARPPAPARAFGLVQRVGDRHAHVGVAEVRERGAVAQLDHAVDDRL